MKFWRKTSLWQMVIKILALFSGLAVASLSVFKVGDTTVTVAGICAFLSAVLAIVMADKDGNGVVDIFEE